METPSPQIFKYRSQLMVKTPLSERKTLMTHSSCSCSSTARPVKRSHDLAGGFPGKLQTRGSALVTIMNNQLTVIPAKDFPLHSLHLNHTR